MKPSNTTKSNIGFIYTHKMKMKMKMKKITNILAVVFIMFILFGCQDKNIEEYNKIANEHQTSIKNAFTELNNTISYYNNKEYEKAKTSAVKCKELFEVTKNLSDQAKKIAEDLKSKEWLVDFKNYSIESEEIRLNQCVLLGQVSVTTQNKNNEKSQKLIDEIGILNQKYNKLQIILEDIKAQHPEAFKNNN